ncbi:hypothetical protein ARMGADRAFT_1086598 [Armillaria gallica]|uniref:Uncharacterized protein n=1 Tax=Armillaria gallica TaxID=47427 RepID=A0A2H3DDU3_ARMGA|nr:hypothetical protein ARMGADRAFT_1086598 [Armillaria gallica]
MPDNRVGGPTFAEAFEFAYVYLTHFGRAGSFDVINSGSGIAAFIRGMAYQCSFGHSDIDIFVPFLIVPKDVAADPDFDVDRLPLDQFRGSGIMISVKDEPSICAWDETISAEELGFWLDGDTEVDVPYVVISIHLAGTRSPLVPSSSEGSPTTPLTLSSDTETPLDTDTNLQQPSDRKDHPRHTINISGCSPSLYKVIDTNEPDKYSRILSPNGILNDYPYKSPASAVLLKKMKPIWSLDLTCFDWAHGMPGVGVVTERKIVLGIAYGRQAVTIEEDGDDGDSDVQMNDEVNITRGPN